MLHNKRFRKMAAVLITVMMLSTACSNSEDQNNGGAIQEEPVNEGQNNNNDHNDSNDATNDNNGTDQEAAEPTDNNEGSEQPSDSDTTNSVIAELATKITTEVQMGSLITLTNEQVIDLYGFDPSELLVDGLFMPAMFNVSSEELTIVQLKSEEHFETVKAGMERRATQIQKTFEQYLPGPYQNALNYQIIRNGDFVLFSISSDQEKVAELFNSYFNK